VSETLSRTFKKLKDEGVIELDGNKITVLNMERLRMVAGK
jgi:CRP/FNR family transcriptional regulator, dissimilatory nitrate respiration regulator